MVVIRSPSSDKQKIEKIRSYIKLIKKNFECTICIDYFENPVITNCQHTFCKKCIENYIGSKRSQGCPLCKLPVNSRSLRSFDSLNAFVEKAKNLEEAFERDLSKTPESAKKGSTSTLSTHISNAISEKYLGECTNTHEKKRKRTISYDKVDSSKKKRSENLNTEKSEDQEGEETELPMETEEQENNEAKVKDIVIQTKRVNKQINSHHSTESTTTCQNEDAHRGMAISLSILNEGSQSRVKREEPCANNANFELANESEEPLKFQKEKGESCVNKTALSKSKTENYQFKTPRQQEIKISNLSKSCGENSKLKALVKNGIIQARETTPVKETNINNLDKIDYDNFTNNYLDNNGVNNENMRVEETILEKTLEIEVEKTRPKTYIDSSTNTDSVETRQKTYVDSSTSMNLGERKEMAVQTNHVDIILNGIDMEKLCDHLLDSVYDGLEFDGIGGVLEEYRNRRIEDSPPAQTRQVEIQMIDEIDDLVTDTIPMPTTRTTTTTITTTKHIESNKIPNKSAFVIQFTDSSDQHKTQKNRNTKNNQSALMTPPPQRHKLLPLEFLNATTPTTQNGIKKENYTISDDVIIIADTPSKTDTLTDSHQNNPHLKRLSKSANRVQVANSTKALFEKSTANFEDSMDSNGENKNLTDNVSLNDDGSGFLPNLSVSETTSGKDQTTACTNMEQEQNQQMPSTTTPTPYHQQQQQNSLSIPFDQPTLILTNQDLTNSATMVVTEEIKQKTPPPKANMQIPEIVIVDPVNNDTSNKTSISFLANSLSTMPLGTTAALLTNNDSYRQMAPPPAANDILGVSLINISTAIEDRSMLAENVKVHVEPKKMKQEMQEDTLTDSAIQAIEDMCKNLNPNLTMVGKFNSTHQSKVASNVNKNMEFVSSLLKPDMKEILKNYATKINAKVSNDVSASTTHLIVDADAELKCGVTEKYLKAISKKIWIVSIAWILNNINAEKMFSPEKFEIKGDNVFGIHHGPKNSRLSKKCLFENYEFLFVGEFCESTISMSTILELVSVTGASIKKDATQFSHDDPSKLKAIIFDETKTKLAPAKAARIKRDSKIDCLSKSWILDSLACYKLLDYETYYPT